MADIIAKNGHIVIRKMKETREDFQLFLKWMTDPQTMKFWEGMTEKFTYERVAQNYAEHVREQVEQCLIEYEGRASGYCQFCVLDAQGFEVPEEEFEKLILAYDLSTRRNSAYMILEEEPEMLERAGYRYPALRFVRKGV